MQTLHFRTLILSLTLGVFALAAVAQTPAAAPARPASSAPPEAVSDQDFSSTQHELIRLLRFSPTLSTVITHDPSLLANQDYVARNNPELAAFLAAHPAVTRNPDFYLFTHRNDGSPDDALARADWPELNRQRDTWPAEDVVGPIAGVFAFAAFLTATIWLCKQFLENRRWSRIFKLQSEVHGRLIDKFSSNQELAGYMETDAGRRFLEAAPIPVGIESGQRMPNVVGRVLIPLQIGIVLVLLAIGFALLRNLRPEMHDGMVVCATLALMPGLGFIISAGITWFLAARLGLMPDGAARLNAAGSAASGYGSRDIR